MTMDDVGAAIILEQKLQRRLAEKREPAHIVREAIKMAAIEEIVLGMGLDEEAFAAVNEAEPHRAMNSAVVPGHPQIFHADLQSPDLVVAHAIVFRQDDVNLVAADFQLPAQAEDHIAQSANFRYGGAFGGNLYDVHKPLSFFVFRARAWRFRLPSSGRFEPRPGLSCLAARASRV